MLWSTHRLGLALALALTQLHIIQQPRRGRSSERAAERLPCLVCHVWDAFVCSPATILRARNKAIANVFDFTEIKGTPQLPRLWSGRHWTCCTAGAQEMIENSQLLTGW